VILGENHKRQFNEQQEKQATFMAGELLIPLAAAERTAFDGWDSARVATAYGVSVQFAQMQMKGQRVRAWRAVPPTGYRRPLGRRARLAPPGQTATTSAWGFTKLPRPCSMLVAPSCCKDFIASRSVARLTPVSLHSSSSVGSPGTGRVLPRHDAVHELVGDGPGPRPREIHQTYFYGQGR
jgi:hypothetical protein